MKNHLIISLLFLSVGLSQKEYDINHIVEQNNVYIKKFSDEIVNGKVFQKFGDMKVPLGKMKGGKKEGKWMVWYDNGTKQEEQNYKDGKKNGLTTEWKENGIKVRETQYLNDEKYGLETYYRKEGGMYNQVDWIDRLNYTNTTFYEDGTIMSKGKFVNNKPYEGQFWSRDNFDGNFIDFRTTRKTYEKGKLIKIEWYGKLDTERRNVVRVDDCINTDDCLSKKEKDKKYNRISEKKVIYEQSPFKILYQVRTSDGKDKEIDIFTFYTGQNIIKNVYIRCLYYKDGNQVDTKRIRMGPFVDYMDDDKITLYPKNIDFDELKVEIVKYE